MSSGDELKNLLLLYRSIDMQYQLGQYTDKSLVSIQKSLDIAREQLFDEISYRDIILPKGREDEILEELNNLTLVVQSQLSKDIQGAAAVAGEYSFREYDQILSFDGKLAETVGFNFSAVSPEQIRAMVMTVPVGGKLLEGWVKDTFDLRITDEIQTAIMADTFQGLSTPKIIRHMENAFGMIRDDAETLVRTYIQSVNNQAAESVYKANSDIVKRERWDATFEVSTVSGRGTCMECAALHGREFPINEPHVRPPKHPLCRCYMTPVTLSFRDLGLDIDDLRNDLKPYTERDENRAILEAGRITGSFNDFLKHRDEQYQRNFLGENRFRLWKSGEITVDDLADKDGNLRLLKKDSDRKYVGLM